MINYYLLTKPGIIFGNLITVAAGFLLASTTLDFGLFAYTLVGLIGIIASACVFNNYIDREVDKKMSRTAKRPLVIGTISEKKALIFGFLLALFGNAILLIFTNFLTVMIANFGLLVYVFLYSLWKGKTIHGTLIGSIAGACPPVIGYTAVSGHLDLAAFILFAILVFWQMPHFYAIAIYRFSDYKNANIPVLPIVKGIPITKHQMTIYIVGFILACLILPVSIGYLILMSTIGLLWLTLSLKGISTTNDHKWAKQMFRFSLITIVLFCVGIIL